MPEIERRLAAIVAIDVAGYSRLMGADEEGTLATLKAHRDALRPMVQNHGGRLVGTAGDSLLLEFPSVVEAVTCAIEIQSAMAERNAGIPEDDKMLFRIGINLGDVLVDDDGDIYGDGVNVAARIESLAEPGGICVSRSARDQVRDRLDIELEDLDEIEVKNIARPVRIFRVLQGTEAARTSTTATSTAANPWVRRLAIAGSFLLLSVIAGAVVWQQPWRERVEAASLKRMAFPLPKKPSIVVLPFANITGDKEKDFIAKGLTDNITARLSQMPQLFVISSGAAASYKSKVVKPGQIAEQLGVRYILDGSITQNANQIRVNTQLIDAISGFHLWSDTYDRQLQDIVGVQDDVTQSIVTALHIKMVEGDAGRNMGGTNNTEAWKLTIKAHHLFRRFNQGDNQRSRELLLEALALDENYVYAKNLLGWVHQADKFWTRGEERTEALRKALRIAEEIIGKHPNYGPAYSLRCGVLLSIAKHQEAVQSCEKGLTLDPNDTVIMGVLAIALEGVERDVEAESWVKQAMRRRPNYPTWYLGVLMRSLAFQGKYDEATNVGQEYLRREIEGKNPSMVAAVHKQLAIVHALAGDEQEAKNALIEALAAYPKQSVSEYVRGQVWLPARAEQVTKLLNDLNILPP